MGVTRCNDYDLVSLKDDRKSVLVFDSVITLGQEAIGGHGAVSVDSEANPFELAAFYLPDGRQCCHSDQYIMGLLRQIQGMEHLNFYVPIWTRHRL